MSLLRRNRKRRRTRAVARRPTRTRRTIRRAWAASSRAPGGAALVAPPLPPFLHPISRTSAIVLSHPVTDPLAWTTVHACPPPLPTRIETVVSEASLIEDIEDIEVIEYPAFVPAFPLHRLVLNKGTDFART